MQSVVRSTIVARVAGTKPRLDIILPLFVCSGLVFFVPFVPSGFVSDSFSFLEAAQQATLSSLLAGFVPSSATWYRPMTQLVFWAKYQLFGLDPLGFNLAATACHIVSSVPLYAIGTRLTRHRLCGVLAGSAFLFGIHAHETVWDIADLHNAL